jgi:hypothetical protein
VVLYILFITKDNFKPLRKNTLFKSMEYIHEQRNVLSKTFCRELIDKFESDSRKYKGMIGIDRVVDTRFKECTDLPIENITGWGVESKHLDDAFNTAFIDYKNYLKLNVFGEDTVHILEKVFPHPNVNRTSFLFGRYGVDGHFFWHTDNNNDHNEERICNCIIYLNDNEACTELLNGKKIKPEAGKIVFFPTTWVHAHRAQTVEKGFKYIITCFIIHERVSRQSLPFLVSYD